MKTVAKTTTQTKPVATTENLPETISVTEPVKKARKPRADKGKKRGPYNKTKTSN